MDRTKQLDAISGAPAVAVRPDHLAWRVHAAIAKLDVSALEAKYSSLGRHGYHPRNVLAVWIYARLIGIRHSTKVGLACKTDAAFRLLSGGYAISAGMLRRFRRENGEFFAQAIEQTVAWAKQEGLLHTDELAVDSMRLRAHASTKAVHTVARSKKRLAELARVDVTALDQSAREQHEAKLAKHRDVIAECDKRGRASIVTTNELAALMKFPNGATLPGHRVTVTAAGVSERIVVGVLVDADATDHGKLGPALEQARQVLVGAGVAPNVRLQAAADAGYQAPEDYAFAVDNRAWVDVIMPVVEGKSPQQRQGYWGREHFVVDGDCATCPAGKPMRGPHAESQGRVKWLGVGCGECLLKSQCTPGKVRALVMHRQTEQAVAAMRERWAQPGAQARYNQRIATVEPVFANLEDTMEFRRASSRHKKSVVAEVLLNVLAHNLSRLADARKLSCVWCIFKSEF